MHYNCKLLNNKRVMKLLPVLLTICLFFIHLSTPIFANHFITSDTSDNPNHPIINEFMPDPTKVTDANGEWIEVFNNASTPIDLNGWKIDDGVNHTIVSANVGFTIPAGGSAVICRNGGSEANGGVFCNYTAPMVLANTGDTVTLKNPGNESLDSVTYTADNVTAGKSIKVANEAGRALSTETTFTYGLGDFGTPASNASVGNRSFATISGAIDAATTGQTVNVGAGQFNENLFINKSVSVIGSGNAVSTIKNDSCGDPVVTIQANNVTIKDFTLNDDDCGYPVIQIEEAITGVLIQGNSIINGDTGIYANSALNNQAHRNAIFNNGSGVNNQDAGNALDASENFWGDQSGPSHGSLNPQGLGNSVSSNVTFRPFYKDSDKTTLSTFSPPAGEFNPVSLFTNGVFSLPSGVTNQTSTTSISVNEQLTLSVALSGGVSTVLLPSGVTITKSGGGTIDATLLATDNVSTSSLSGFSSGTVVEGALQWGIPNLGLEFDQAITLNIFTGTSLNGQTLNVRRSTSTGSGWTATGIVAPATCTVANGSCSFQATKASYFATTRTVATTTTSTTQATTTPAGPFPAPTCSDQKPGSAPTLISASSEINSVQLNWSKAKDPVTYYLITYGLGPGLQNFGNANVGGADTTSFTIQGLSGGTTYYFKVRAGNGCAPGNFSNELSSTPPGRPVSTPAIGFAPGVLGAKTQTLEQEATATPLPKSPSSGIEVELDQLSPAKGNLFSAVFGFFSNLFGLIKNLFGR